MARLAWNTNLVLLAHYLLGREQIPAVHLRKIAGLDGKLGIVTATCFVLYRMHTVDQSSAHRLLFHTAPQLVHQLNRTAISNRVVLRDRPRGKIDWPATYKARAAEGMNSTLFICLESQRRYSRPENQLLKWVIFQIERCLDRVPAEMNDWLAWGWNRVDRSGGEEIIGEDLAVLRHKVRQIGMDMALRHVEMPRSIEDRHLRAARSSKNRLYSEVADLYDVFAATVVDPHWDAWSTMVRETFPLPPDMRELALLLDTPIE